ncbi:hypothetical protein TBR22_A17480 [Luteitalea sp. TBR-22]|uniref:PEP-CTERM sorting domain-containing protein n=1 Tax=Luteitalea sp. TBR-22 TaxID=2802971 RepID=UPI001AF189D8|nr:PEP-CTERM sorting domain-containing protein [Luteitalea sp. TBR-22]BCS32533.1 hypothetical protein TBR22_A17480 [Luteitalea sp. TBR-22]
MPIASIRRIAAGLALALGLTLASSTQAAAAVVYDFSLPANGDVGAVRIVLTTSDFITPSDLDIFPLTAAQIAVSSDDVVDKTQSVIGVDIEPDVTLFGINLRGPGGLLLLFTEDYPADFFIFERTPTQTGTFTSVSGIVVSDDELETRAPTATLVVSGTPDVPEPASLTLLGAAAAGLIARRRRQTRRS